MNVMKQMVKETQLINNKNNNINNIKEQQTHTTTKDHLYDVQNTKRVK